MAVTGFFLLFFLIFLLLFTDLLLLAEKDDALKSMNTYCI